MRPIRSFPSVLLFLAPVMLNAGTYTVKAGGGGNFTTIQACANAAVAGDTCQVAAGTYDERVTISSSGSAGLPITFLGGSSCSTPDTCPKVRGFSVSSGRPYIDIRGFEVTRSGMSSDTSPAFVVSGTDHVSILNNYIHDTCSGTTGTIAISASGSSPKATYTHISGNTFTNIGCPGNRLAVINMWFDNALIENNDASHSSDFVNTMGHMNVIRKNVFHDFVESDTQTGNNHIDGWQTYCAGSNPAPEEGNRTLIEGNYQYNAASTNTNSHFGLVNNSSSCGTSYNIIVRYNTGYKYGSSFYVADTSSTTDSFHKVYNNTAVSAVNPGDYAAVSVSGVATGSVMNNIFYNAMRTPNPEGYHLNRNGDPTSTGDYNFGYFSSGSLSWIAPINSEPHHLLNQDPLFVNAAGDFHLQSGSPARGAGGPLTTVSSTDSGSGTTLVLKDASFFQPGWAGVNADWIRVGPTTAVQISSIDYATNAVTLASSITRSPGDPVYLYRDSSGQVVLSGSAPDMGAFQGASGQSPDPPQKLTAVAQ